MRLKRDGVVGFYKFKVIINAQFYGLSKQRLIDAGWGSDPVPASATTPEGRSILNGKVLAGKTAKQMFYISNTAQTKPSYKFGFGAALTNSSAAVGGGGPIIINSRQYGNTNLYNSGVPAGAPATGEPPSPYD